MRYSGRLFAWGKRPARFCAPVIDREIAAPAAPLGEPEPDELVDYRHRALARDQVGRFMSRQPRQRAALIGIATIDQPVSGDPHVA